MTRPAGPWLAAHHRLVAAAVVAVVIVAVAVGVYLPRAAAPLGRPAFDGGPAAGVPRLGDREPARLLLPAIGVDAAVEYVAADRRGDMGVPSDPRDVAWYQPGVLPGTSGDAVIAGHFDWTSGPAVFWNLRDVRPGQSLAVVYRDGSRQGFQVTRVTTYPNDREPAYLFRRGGPAMLSLITCAGAWDGARQQYRERLVVDSSPT